MSSVIELVRNFNADRVEAVACGIIGGAALADGVVPSILEKPHNLNEVMTGLGVAALYVAQDKWRNAGNSRVQNGS